MCFSTEASFSVSAVLLGIGALTWKSVREPQEQAYAAIPLLFGIQQFIEGMLWLALHHDAPQIVALMTYAYSFFAQLLWPVYVPLAVLLIEPVRWRRQSLLAGALAGLMVSSWRLYSITEYGVVAQIHGQHIVYVSHADQGELTLLLYMVSTIVCLLISSHRTAQAFGLLAWASFVMAQAIYARWFISVWCYFAAFLSAVVLLHFKISPAPCPRTHRG